MIKGERRSKGFSFLISSGALNTTSGRKKGWREENNRGWKARKKRKVSFVRHRHLHASRLVLQYFLFLIGLIVTRKIWEKRSRRVVDKGGGGAFFPCHITAKFRGRKRGRLEIKVACFSLSLFQSLSLFLSPSLGVWSYGTLHMSRSRRGHGRVHLFPNGTIGHSWNKHVYLSVRTLVGVH